MREDLLHFIWKYKKLQLSHLLTSNAEPVEIVDVGLHNHLAGPDFFNAKIRINNQLWAGNVEIHIQSSDWYVHQHEKDANYDNVILHVVWQDDAAVFRNDGSEIPTVALKNYVSSSLLDAYKKLFKARTNQFINCESEIRHVNEFIVSNWFERLYFERLENKSNEIEALLSQSNNDWEAVFFKTLLKNFGLKINKDSFTSLSEALDFSVVRKLNDSIFKLESVFYGMTHLLEENGQVDTYFLELKKEYDYLKNKFSLEAMGVIKPSFFKLRPPNFPTIRLSQLANLYGKEKSLFNKIIEAKSLEEFYSLFNVTASDYWSTHFTFGKISKKNSKPISKKFVDLLIINTILPIKFHHAQKTGNAIDEELIAIISDLKSEENSIITNFRKSGIKANNAKDSQALLQLYTSYCSKNKCLQCSVGGALLNVND